MNLCDNYIHPTHTACYSFQISVIPLPGRHHQPGTGLEMLRVQKISQAQAWQRTGRAGRQSAGACYRVYTRAEFDAMPRDTVPEIQRCDLAGVALQLLTIGVRDVRNFDFLDRPDGQVSSSPAAGLGVWVFGVVVELGVWLWLWSWLWSWPLCRQRLQDHG